MPNVSMVDGRIAGLLRDSRPTSPLAELLDGVQAEVRELMVRHQLEPAVAEEILGSVLNTLVWKWEAVRDRETWLLAVLARRLQQASEQGTLGDQQ